MPTIWCNAAFPPPVMQKLRAGTGHHRLIFSQRSQNSNLVNAGEDPDLPNADIAYGQPDPDQVIKCPKLKWIHLTSAGYTRYDFDTFKSAMKSRGGIVTNSSAVFEEPCAEHLLAMMLSLARRLPDSLDEQRGSRAWNYLPLRAKSKLLMGQNALIVGFGAIGQRVAELLEPFRMNLIAVRRKPRGDEKIRTVPNSQLDEVLPQADHVINVLPSSAETDGMFSASRIARMKPSAFFYNIGRGTTVDQDALQTALEQKKIAAAYLDVTTPEPLPPDHPLWRLPNCFITPHTGGGHDNELERNVDHFLENLRRFDSNQELLNRVI